MAGRDVARGVGVAMADRLADAAAVGLALVCGVLTSAGEELVDEAPGRDAEHATVTTKSRSAAITRRIPRPYVVTSRRFIKASFRIARRIPAEN